MIISKINTMNVHNICNICYEHNITTNIQYICDSKCFFNNKLNCIICDECITNWIKTYKKIIDNKTIFKCPICNKWGLKLIEDIEKLNETDSINNIQEQDIENLNETDTINNIQEQDIEQNNQCCSCNLNINCNFRIFLEKLSRFINKYNIYLRIILYLLLLIIIGFIISSLWMIIFEYDIDTFKEEVIHKKWTDPIYYIIICPLVAAIFIIISLLCIGCIKCLDNIC